MVAFKSGTRREKEDRALQICVDGELTARTAGIFCQAVEDGLHEGAELTVVAENVKDVDVVGLAVLLQATRRAAQAGIPFTVVPSVALRRALLEADLLDDVPVGERGILGDSVRAVSAVWPDGDGDVIAATARMTLRLPRWDDFRYFERWAAEPVLDQMVGSTLLHRCRHLGAYDTEFVSQVSADPTSLTVLIVPPECPEPVGFVRLYHIDLVERFGFLETAVGDVRALRRGWGITASRLLLCYAMDVLELRRIEAKVYAYNVLSINALSRNGFVLEGRLREGRHYDGRRWDLLVFGILQAEMAAQRAPDHIAPIALWPSEATDA